MRYLDYGIRNNSKKSKWNTLWNVELSIKLRGIYE